MFYREAGDFKTSYQEDSQTFPIRFDRYRYYVVLLVAFAGPVSSYTQATGEQLANPQRLIETLLPDAGETP